MGKMPVTDRDKPCGSIRYFAAWDVTCYLLHGSRGDLLIDTGLPMLRKGLAAWMQDQQVKLVFLTHAHVDHDSNAAWMQQQGAKILLSERDRDLRQHYLRQPVHPTAKRYLLRNALQLLGGGFWNSPRYEADVYFTDADAGLLRTYGFDAQIIPLAGHTLGSCGILSGGVLYCGDAFTALWGRPDITPHAHSIPLMQASLRRILEIDPEWLACGHGLPLRMQDAKPVIQEYLRQHHLLKAANHTGTNIKM